MQYLYNLQKETKAEWLNLSDMKLNAKISLQYSIDTDRPMNQNRRLRNKLIHVRLICNWATETKMHLAKDSLFNKWVGLIKYPYKENA